MKLSLKFGSFLGCFVISLVSGTLAFAECEDLRGIRTGSWEKCCEVSQCQALDSWCSDASLEKCSCCVLKNLVELAVKPKATFDTKKYPKALCEELSAIIGKIEEDKTVDISPEQLCELRDNFHKFTYHLPFTETDRACTDVLQTVPLGDPARSALDAIARVSDHISEKRRDKLSDFKTTMISLGGSQNPVSRLRMGSVLASDLDATLKEKPSIEEMEFIVSRLSQDAHRSLSHVRQLKKMEVQKIVTEFTRPYLLAVPTEDAERKQKIYAEAYFLGRAKDSFDACATLADPDLKIECQDKIMEFVKPYLSSNLKLATAPFKKITEKDLLRKLKEMESQKIEDELRADIINSLSSKSASTAKTRFVSWEDLQEAYEDNPDELKTLEKHLQSHLHYRLDELFDKSLHGLEPKVFYERLLNELVRPKRSQNFAFKMGLESERELLAGRILGQIGLHSHVVPKYSLQLRNAKMLAGERIFESPKGIVSSWIQGKPMDMQAWRKYLHAKQEVDLMKFQLKELEKPGAKGRAELEEFARIKRELPALESALSTSKGKLTSTYDQESVQNLAVVDLLLGSFDSHWNQYIQKEGQLKTFDMARFLPTADFAVTASGKTFIPNRMSLMDHPFSELPLTPSLKKTVLAIDLDKLDTVKDQLTWSEKEYKELKVKLPDIQKILSALDRKTSLSEAEKKLRASLLTENHQIRETIFKKAAPDAYENFKARIRIAQEELKKDPQISPTSLYEKMHPEYTPFISVIKRIEKMGAFSGLSITQSDGPPRLRSLEEVIEIAKKSKSATEEEIKKMEDTLKAIQRDPKKLTTSQELYNTMMDAHLE